MNDRDKTGDPTGTPKPLQVHTDPGRPIDTSRQLLRGLNKEPGDPAELASLLGGVPVEKNVVIEVPKSRAHEGTDPGPLPTTGPSVRGLAIGAGCIILLGGVATVLSARPQAIDTAATASTPAPLTSASASAAQFPATSNASATQSPTAQGTTSNASQTPSAAQHDPAAAASAPLAPPRATTTARAKPTSGATTVPSGATTVLNGRPFREDIE
jgi:hypothetical protein